MTLDTSRTRHGLAFLVLPFVVGLAWASPTWAQTAAPAAQPATPDKPHKSKRLDKHAPPWEVIWNTRLWTDVPETQEFVKETHPDPKQLDYAPLVGKEPDRPKPRDAKGIAALQAELEGEIKHNEARGKAINDVAPPKADKGRTRKARAAKPGREKKTAKAATRD